MHPAPDHALVSTTDLSIPVAAIENVLNLAHIDKGITSCILRTLTEGLSRGKVV